MSTLWSNNIKQKLSSRTKWAPLAETQCPRSNATMVHPSESGLSFIMSCNSPPQSIQGHVDTLVQEFCKLPHSLFFQGPCDYTTHNFQHSVLENRPLVQKLHYASLRKTLVSRDPPTNGFLVNGMTMDGPH
jgi:hypothetical protein